MELEDTQLIKLDWETALTTMETSITNRNILRKAATRAWRSLTRVIRTAGYRKQLSVLTFSTTPLGSVQLSDGSGECLSVGLQNTC